MRKALPIAGCRLPVESSGAAAPFSTENRKSKIENAFSLVEVLVVVSLLSFIVLALMAVFSNTQRAFRAATTQTDVLEGGRATMELMASDLRTITPSGGASNVLTGSLVCPVNFAVLGNYNFDGGYAPLPQTLPSGSVLRTNVLNYFFLLGRENTKWTGTGYVVDTTGANPQYALYPLYRFYAETNTTLSPQLLYELFDNQVRNLQFTNMSHLIDGVAHLAVRGYDPQGHWLNGANPTFTNTVNTYYFNNAYGEAHYFMFSNTVPAAVEVELGVLEDTALARAASIPVPAVQQNFLSQQSGALHLFRQRVTVPNVDPTAYP